jgi:protoporphyrinogen oxidase
LDKLRYKNEDGKSLISDNWIYVQEPDVKLGRIVVYNNFSQYMVNDSSKVWLGLDYFCDEGDALWNMTDNEMRTFATKELEQLGFIDSSDVLDAIIIKEKKSYPAYFGTYDRFQELRSYVDTIQNLFLIGRNGMHKYNNQDHSMLCAMTAVDNIISGITDKDNIWNVNAEQDYHG